MIRAAVLMFLCAAQAVYAQKFDPNAPAKKTVTVGSEITRGSSAVSEATREVSPADVAATWRAANKVIAHNQQQNTDTDGFLLGAQFRAWTSMAILEKLDAKVVDTSRAQELGRIYFVEYRKLQRQLGIDDATLCKLAGIRHEAIKSDIDKWSKLK